MVNWTGQRDFFELKKSFVLECVQDLFAHPSENGSIGFFRETPP
jgi:hypothetical protein